MAFPIPSHLPRKPNPLDVSSSILSKIDTATNQSLNSTLATSWLVELEETIQSTKKQIHERVHADLPKFEQQLALSKSVQSNLQSLTDNVALLSETISNPETGVIPTLVRELAKHGALAQDAMDASVQYGSLSHLLQCRTQMEALTTLVHAGKLPDAVCACDALEKVIEDAPVPVNQTNVIVDIRRKFRAAKARAEDQLSDAYTRSVIVSSTQLVIRKSVQVRQSETVLPLSSIITSMSSSSLLDHLATLRRDLTIHFIDHIFKQPNSVRLLEEADTYQHKLSFETCPSNVDTNTLRLHNISQVLDFLSANFFNSLQPPQTTLFPRSLCKPLTMSLLNNFLIPTLPSSFDSIPAFLELLQEAVLFEEKYIVAMLGNDSHDRPIKAWADGVCGHYERQRRLEILESSRIVITAPEDMAKAFTIEVELTLEVEQPMVVPVQTEDEVKTDAWGLEDDSGAGLSAGAEEDGWGFDGEVLPEPESVVLEQTEEPVQDEELDEDPSDAWGWNDGDDLPAEDVEETAWDDPWSEEPTSSSDSRPPPAPSIIPKSATHLEKMASKGKKTVNGTSSVDASPVLSHTEPLSVKTAGKRPSNLALEAPKETYLVSGRTTQIINMVKGTLKEGNQFVSSSIFPLGPGSTPGNVILQTASSTLDLYRAIYPVKFQNNLELPENAMRFSNDCLYLSDEIKRIENGTLGSSLVSVKEHLSECRHHLKVLGESWFYDTIDKQSQSIDQILNNGTQGFMYTGEQDRFDECESAIGQTLQEIRRFAQRLKGILPKSKYYIAIGMVTNAVLSRVLQDILALPDIPEVESHRLSELCRILNALEGLFVENSEQPSFVVAYVPSWLKFSYLHELLEASMADITYLFEEGALVDFDVDELARLVRALFADTTLRTTTINKLMGGHPVPS